MKKLSLVLVCTLLLALFAGCGASSSSAAAGGNIPGTLEEIMEKLYEGIDENNMPMVANTELTADNAESFVGVPASAFKEGLSSDAMINAVAHSVCLLRAEDAAAAEELAKAVEENADPRKWICVEAEKKVVEQRGDLVLLVMSGTDLADQIVANFQALETE